MGEYPVTHETIEDLYEAVHGDQLLMLAQGEFWIAWETVDGDWFAVRPRHEDDPEGENGDRWRPVGPVKLEEISFPVTVVEACDAIGGAVEPKARSDADWQLFQDRQGGA